MRKAAGCCVLLTEDTSWRAWVFSGGGGLSLAWRCGASWCEKRSVVASTGALRSYSWLGDDDNGSRFSRSRVWMRLFSRRSPQTFRGLRRSFRKYLRLVGRFLGQAIGRARRLATGNRGCRGRRAGLGHRSEEHTSELQSRGHLVCRLLLEKKKHEEWPQTCKQ